MPILMKPFSVFYLLSLGKVHFALSSTDHTFYLLNLIWNYLSTKRAQCLNYEVSFL